MDNMASSPAQLTDEEQVSGQVENHSDASQLRPHEKILNSYRFKDILSGVEEDRGSYNRMLAFAKGNNNISSASATHHLGAEVVKTLEDINGIFSTAFNEICEKFYVLQDQKAAFYKATMEDPRAYEGDNLLALRSDELEVAMKHLKVDDAEHFGDYVIRCISESQLDRTPPDEYDEDGARDPDSFPGKCFFLIQKMMNLNLRRQSLHALIELKSVLHDTNPRWGSDTCFDFHEDLDEMILAYGDEKCIADWARACENELYPTDHSTHICNINVNDLQWRLDPARGSTFLDFASPCRVLYGAYENVACSRTTTGCFHNCVIDVLDWLQRKAWAEIRAKTFLTIGILLPPELTLAIFTHALKVEGIPEDPSIWEKKWRKSKQKPHEKKPWRWQAKERYRCGRTLSKGLDLGP